uniref:Uncharacterized protein n=1 Tax=Parascaris univalens TaxID=6257 RepID=A0A915AE30_PARUN
KRSFNIVHPNRIPIMCNLSNILIAFFGCIVIVGSTALPSSLYQRTSSDLRTFQSQPLRSKRWYDWNNDDTRLHKRWYDWQVLPLSDSIDLTKKNRLSHLKGYPHPGSDWFLG